MMDIYYEEDCVKFRTVVAKTKEIEGNEAEPGEEDVQVNGTQMDKYYHMYCINRTMWFMFQLHKRIISESTMTQCSCDDLMLKQ